tara:strand:+ start:434 stop:829 length:396 start_codon:yes stop_codon:yes gene_type:complete
MKMKLLIENFKKFLNEQQSQQPVSFDTEGTQTTIEFLGMDTPYDQTFVELRINGEELTITAYGDIDDLADSVISELEEDDSYWFLVEPVDEDVAAEFKQQLMAALKQLGADPSADEDVRTSYRDRDTGGMY